MTKSQRLTLVSRVGEQVSSRLVQSISMGGSALSSKNLLIFKRCLEAWLFLVEDLMLRQGLSEPARRARSQNFVIGLASADLTATLKFLEELYHFLIGSDPSVETFKQFLIDGSPESLDWRRLLSPVNQVIYSFLNETNKESKAHLLASIALFLRFPRKLEFQDIGLELEALREYEGTEKELAAVVLDDIPELVKSLADIVKEWFDDFHIGDLLPSHGPGSVAEGSLTTAEKFGAMKVDTLVKVLLRNPSFPDSWKEYFPFQPCDGLVRHSRTVFVPKTASKLRTISMEPATLQYIQQGVMKALYGYIDRHPYLGVHVTLEDQRQNQVWAMVGSKYGNYCTIDLSHASDSVSWDLVRRVFSVVPGLYKWLIGTRSHSTILPDGTVLRLNKFAPMGSALCFPIECIIFSAVVEHALRKASLDRSEPTWFWSVYGDDIVCPSCIYEDVINILGLLGFVPNRRKSYCSGPYRESCGKEYYEGFDITPLYYRTPFYRHKPSPSAFGSWASSANNALLSRLPLYRWYLVDKCLRTSHRCGPYFDFNPNMSPHLYSPEPTNFHVRKRWNSDYQRWEGRFVSVKCQPRSEEPDDDTLKYFIRLVEMARRPQDVSCRLDESPLPTALRGCVERFSSTILPITPYVSVDKTLAYDWQDT